MPASDPRYLGRFAPTPSGPLHIGSIMAALASYLDAKKHGGKWLVRIEDLDRPRVKPGASDAILRTLETLGLHWDGEIVFQSSRIDAYAEARSRLAESHLLYPCICPRRIVKDGPYPGTCRRRTVPASRRHALRVVTHDRPVGIRDRLQGDYFQRLEKDVGDFILMRADGYYAYHLATVVDDAWQHVSHVVRGGDLLESTPRQVYLQQLLNVATPEYLHIPVAVDERGIKISKSTNGLDVLIRKKPADILIKSLELLGQKTDKDMVNAPAEEIGAWATKHWQPAAVPRNREITAG